MTDILLFAAGLGTRMGALTADRPKPLVDVGGKALIDHALALTEIPAITHRVANTHYKADQLRARLVGKGVSISDESDLLRDTGGGLRHALPLLASDPILTLNTDAIWSGPNPLPLLLDAWHGDMDCLLMLVPKAQVHGHKGTGDFLTNTAGRLSRGAGDIYSGLQLIKRSALDGISETVFSMNLVWDRVAARGGLYGTTYPGQWCDVGQPDSIPLAEALLESSRHV